MAVTIDHQGYKKVAAGSAVTILLHRAGDRASTVNVQVKAGAGGTVEYSFQRRVHLPTSTAQHVTVPDWLDTAAIEATAGAAVSEAGVAITADGIWKLEADGCDLQLTIEPTTEDAEVWSSVSIVAPR